MFALKGNRKTRIKPVWTLSFLLRFGSRKTRGSLTLFGPSPPEAEGDEGNYDEDKSSQNDTNYEVGEVTRSGHRPTGVIPAACGL